jgi:hypothetical protein
MGRKFADMIAIKGSLGLAVKITTVRSDIVLAGHGIASGSIATWKIAV